MSINLINYALAKKDWEKAYEDLKALEIGGRNYFIIKDAVEDHALRWADGELFYEKGSLTSGFIPAKKGEQFIFSHTVSQVIYYRADKTRIALSQIVNVNSIVVPNRDDIAYFRISLRNNFLNGNSKYNMKVKIEKGNKATDWTPAPEDIDAHPFVAELAETVYRSKQNEERIRNLENALTALGGGS